MTEAEIVLSLTTDLDRILRTDKHFLMADWIAAARKFGASHTCLPRARTRNS